MQQVFLDATLRSKLNNLSLPLELCDESGKVVALVVAPLNESQFERVELTNQVFLDAELRSKLHDLSLPLDLCDESGKVVAQVVPALDESDYERVEPPPLSAEELERRRNEPGPDYSTEEVLAHLKSL